MTGEPPGGPGRALEQAIPAAESQFYIQATSPFADEHTRVLKHGDTFAVFDHYGDIKPAGLGEEGIYHEGTRYLSCLLLALGKDRPLFLSSTVKQDNAVLAVDLTNVDVFRQQQIAVPRGTVHLFRSTFLYGSTCYHALRLRNYGLSEVHVPFSLHFEADFADIFEVRGTRRPRRGKYLGGKTEPAGAVLVYEGLDGVVRRTRLQFTPPAVAITETGARFDVTLGPQAEATYYLTVSCERGRSSPPVLSFAEALDRATTEADAGSRHACTLHASNEQFNAWVDRATADLRMMTTHTIEGPYPYAGVPWFSTPFGRDGVITALERLWMDPALARGVLSYLAATQAHYENPLQDAEPGKILHETRDGEMAALGEIPFGRYYGSVDATPLFVMLAGAYYTRTADLAFVQSIWPNIDMALAWMDRYGDADGDGFVEYQRQSSKGLVQQGWKDSHDSIFHADGSLARPPIALCEVQGYVYRAKLAGAELATALGDPERAQSLYTQAERLRERFETAFWCEELGTYALALDGDKEQCRVRASNAGHCLLTGIAAPERARRTARTLLAPESFSGWGIRTLAEGEARYNPMSYHNGSVWPHDNALIAAGLARYGEKDAVIKVLCGMFDTGLFMDLHRMPELFCGFGRRSGEGPTLYPVACAPQAWSAAAVFFLVQASLGLSVEATGQGGHLCFSYPLLPPFLKELRLRNLRIGAASLDLLLLRHGYDVGINVLRREGQIEIQMLK
jgi:glycogen debranching enzyme